MAHVDDFLCTGRAADLKWLESRLKGEFDVTATHVGDDAEKEVRYLNRILRWTEEGLEIESEGRHAATLLKEWGMSECKTIDTPLRREVVVKMGIGKELGVEDTRKLRRAIARVKYMAHYRPDLSVPSRLLAQHMAKPT